MDLLDEIAGAMQTPDEAEGRVFGYLLGVITEVDKDTGKVRARFGAMEDGESSDWIRPAWGGAIEEIPAVGDKVAVDFLDGDPTKPRYTIYVTGSSKGRPTEPILFGYTFIRLYNDLVGKFNNLLTLYKVHTHTAGPWPTTPPLVFDTDLPAAQALDSDNSAPGALATPAVVLSAVAKVK